MNRPTRLLLTALVPALLLATAVSAQELEKLAGTTPQMRADVQTKFMKSRLGLSEEQAPKVATINLQYAEKMQPILESDEGPLRKMGAAREVEQAKDAALQRVLSPEQYQKYLAAKQELRQRVEQKAMEKSSGGSTAN
jgi:hypothetical protein